MADHDNYDDLDERGPGRPQIGGSALIRLGSLLARVDGRAKVRGLSRAEIVRQAVSTQLGPEHPTVEQMKDRLRADYVSVVKTSWGTKFRGTPKIQLYRTLTEARDSLTATAHSAQDDPGFTVIEHSDWQLVVSTDREDHPLTMQYVIVQAAPVAFGPALTRGEADVCRAEGVDPEAITWN